MSPSPPFKSYAVTVFPQELAVYAAAHSDDSGSEHCQAPAERRARVEPKDAMRFTRKFALTWSGLTLLEQTIFRHFPDAHPLWLNNNPDLKLPAWDLSKIDFDKLKDEFKKATYKNIEINDLRSFLEEKLQQMLSQNRTRRDFAERLQDSCDKQLFEEKRDKVFEHTLDLAINHRKWAA